MLDYVKKILRINYLFLWKIMMIITMRKETALYWKEVQSVQRSRESAPLYHQSKPHSSDSGGTKWLVIGILVYSSKVLFRSESLKHTRPLPSQILLNCFFFLGGGRTDDFDEGVSLIWSTIWMRPLSSAPCEAHGCWPSRLCPSTTCWTGDTRLGIEVVLKFLYILLFRFILLSWNVVIGISFSCTGWGTVWSYSSGKKQ